MDRYMMISQDCHAGAPWFVYRKYLDPKFREDYDQWITEFLGGSTNVGQAEIEKEKQVCSAASWCRHCNCSGVTSRIYGITLDTSRYGRHVRNLRCRSTLMRAARGRIMATAADRSLCEWRTTRG